MDCLALRTVQPISNAGISRQILKSKSPNDQFYKVPSSWFNPVARVDQVGYIGAEQGLFHSCPRWKPMFYMALARRRRRRKSWTETNQDSVRVITLAIEYGLLTT